MTALSAPGPSVAIMQPYVFPYVGYFQLIRAVDHFVVYDDVQFIKRGWINRNRISNNGTDALFTVPVQGASQSVRICDVITAVDDKWLRKFATQLQHEYSKAAQYAEVRDLVLGCLEAGQGVPVSELCVMAMQAVMRRLDLAFVPLSSDRAFGETRDLKRAERLIAITRQLNCRRYVNLPGGMALYGTAEFAEQDVDLRFIFDRSESYPQFGQTYLPKLSIIDVLMHNTPDRVRAMLDQYDLLSAEDAAARSAPTPEEG